MIRPSASKSKRDIPAYTTSDDAHTKSDDAPMHTMTVAASWVWQSSRGFANLMAATCNLNHGNARFNLEISLAVPQGRAKL
eukprot:1052818-Pelagomonas_calceolata.AAC.1